MIIATQNAGKAKEIRYIAGKKIKNIQTLDQLGIILPENLEAFPDYQSNAMAKAQYVFNKTGIPVLADDSGLEVDALGSKPGIHSARYAPEGSDLANRNLLLDRLKGLCLEDRKASFVCILCWICPLGIYFFEGRSHGLILERAIGEKGFGYDPIFFDPNLKKTYAELSFEEKMEVSHRGKALEKWIDSISTEGGI